VYLLASKRRKARVESTVSICERSINIVSLNKPKVLKGLNQKVPQWEQGLKPSLSWTSNAAGEESGPNLILLHVRNTVSSYSSHHWESDPQGKPTGVRVEECGESEGRLVMRRIGVAT
jgi:hypothetical protein